MARFLLIQENGRNAANREFRECFALQRAWRNLGHEAEIWGLGHDSFSQPLEFSKFDVIFNLENYDDRGWLPDLSRAPCLKLMWAVDEHCRDVSYYAFLRERDKTDIVLHSTRRFACGDGDWWCPNFFDDTLIGPRRVALRADVGFCGNVLNRGGKLELLRRHFHFVADIMVLGASMVEAVNSYRIHFNCNLTDDINSRSFETVGCGVPLASNANPQYGELGFVDADNCILYANEAELIDKLRWWLDHPNDLARLREKSLELAKLHTCEARCRWLWDRLREHL